MIKKGITIIEVLVSITIITILSSGTYFGIIEFQRNTLLDSTAEEFASTIETARSMSISGLAISETTVDDYEGDFLPYYGIKVEADKYSLFTTYRKIGENTDTIEVVNSNTIPDDMAFFNQGEIYFARRSGVESGVNTFTINRKNSTSSRQITIGKQIIITKI